MSSNYSKKIYKDLGGDEEPVDFDFFDDGASGKTKYQSKINKELFSRRSRPTTPPGKQASTSFSPRSTDLESARSAASSRSSCLSVRLPTSVSHSRNDVASDESDDEDKDYSLNQINSVPSKPDLEPKIKNIKNSSPPYPVTVSKHERPKTSRSRPTTTRSRPSPNPGSRSRTGDQSSDSGSYSSSFTSDSSYSSDSRPASSDSDSDTDSGSVTDVSPLQSPNLPDNLKNFSCDYKKVQEKMRGSKKIKFSSSRPRERHHSEGSTMKSKKESVRFEGVGLNPPNGHRATPGPGWNESEAQELSMLLRAVLEMDKTPKTLVQMPGTRRSRPTSAKSNLSTKGLPHKRMNMSFSNDRVRQIDRENQRLLQQIMNKSGVELQNTGVKTKPKRPLTSQSATSFNGNHQSRLSHSALRRQRENRRIEIENMKILSRIDSTKPTREITKEALLEDHYKLTRYGQQVSKSPFRRISAKSTSGQPSMSEASSLLSLYSNASSSKAGSKGRPIHMKKLDLEPPPRQPKPAWDDHW